MKLMIPFFLIIFSSLVSANLIISEVMPNPKGEEKALEPNGEWVELHNPTEEKIALAHYLIKDSKDENELYIDRQYIQPKQYLAVYRNMDSDFSLNNRNDKVRLFYNGTLIDEMEYSSSKEGMSKALTRRGWFDQPPSPNEPNAEEDLSDTCDWKLDLEINSSIMTRPYWRITITKLYGGKNKLILRRTIHDEDNSTVKEYKPMEFEATRSKTVRNNPRLKPGVYTVTASIESLGCNDPTDNIEKQLIYIKDNKTKEQKPPPKPEKKPESFNNTKERCINNEIVINTTRITGNTAYESNDYKAKRYAIYVFCLTLVLLIISLKVEKNENTGSNRKIHT